MKLFLHICRWLGDQIEAWWNTLQDELIERRWRDAALSVLAAISGIAIVVSVTGICIILLNRYGRSIVNAIWLPLAVLWSILYLARKSSAVTAEDPPEPDSLSHEFAVANWDNVASVVLQCVEHCCGPLGIVKPLSISDLDCPAARVVQRGKVFFYQLMMTKTNPATPIDPAVFKNILQSKITNGLNNSLFDGVSDKTVLIDGMSYPVYMIDDVRDGSGMVTVLIVQPSKFYIDQLRTRRQAQALVDLGTRPPEDKDI